MPILNYTTSVSTEKTASQIQSMLIAKKATAIMSEYDNGVLASISFKINTPHGELFFKLPANCKGVYKALQSSRRAEKSHAQAARVAWRIMKDWIEAQLAIIDAEMATMQEVFLPYALTSSGQTVYERFEKGGAGTLGITYQGGENGKK